MSDEGARAEAVRAEARSPDFRIACVETAKSTIGDLTPGCRIVGVTKGQFSLLDLVKACLESTGPAHLVLSTWTAADADQENLKWILESEQIHSLKLMIDRSFKTLKGERCELLRQQFGAASVIMTFTHAKFALLKNNDWALAIRSSMNLNRNPRFEQFDIDDDPLIHDFLERVVDEVAAATPNGMDSTNEEFWDGFNNTMITETCGGEVVLPDLQPQEPLDLPARVAKLAGLQFSAVEIVTMLGLEILEGDLDVAYRRGQLLAEEQIRRTMLARATTGDPKAVEAFRELTDVRKREDKKRPLL